VTASKLKPGEHLLTANGTPAVADGGTTPKDDDGWMWDLTIPHEHDFYIGTTELRRVLIAFDYRADGIWWVATKEEIEASSGEQRCLNREHRRLTSHRPVG
jgi:hypothetical protein